MNYYERIQRAIDYIERNLRDEIDLQSVASEACMSLAGLYRLFFSMTGYRVKEYIRARRISEAAQALATTDRRVLEIALDCGFESHEAFSRAFKQFTGQSPRSTRGRAAAFYAGRIDVMEMSFEEQDPRLAAEYPEIKVLKELGPMRVAFYRHISVTPEVDAFAVMRGWVADAGLEGDRTRTRYFGFNNPNPSPDHVQGVTEYGYEVWVTVDDDFIIADERIGSKTTPGGRYAVMTLRVGDGECIERAWKRFAAWLERSPYSLGDHQWLEEHLDFGDDQGCDMTLDLYMPIK